MSATDKYPMEQDNSPALNGFTVTPDDTEELEAVTRAIYIGSGGDIKVLLKEDVTPVILKNVPTGSILPFRVKKVYASDTSASFITGLY